MKFSPTIFPKQRLEAFTDGIIAIIITIMVLSIPLPESFEWHNVLAFLISILIYFLSFIVVGAFWNQHHLIFYYIDKVSNKIIASNFLYLFFLSLIPLLTKWVIENPGALLPVIGFSVVYLLVNLCYAFIFHYVIDISEHKDFSTIKQMRKSRKEFWDMEGKSPSSKIWIRFSFMVAAVGGIAILSIHKPGIFTIILMGIPVLFSLLNLFFPDFKPERRKSRGE